MRNREGRGRVPEYNGNPGLPGPHPVVLDLGYRYTVLEYLVSLGGPVPGIVHGDLVTERNIGTELRPSVILLATSYK